MGKKKKKHMQLTGCQWWTSELLRAGYKDNTPDKKKKISITFRQWGKQSILHFLELYFEFVFAIAAG